MNASTRKRDRDRCTPPPHAAKKRRKEKLQSSSLIRWVGKNDSLFSLPDRGEVFLVPPLDLYPPPYKGEEPHKSLIPLVTRERLALISVLLFSREGRSAPAAHPERKRVEL